VDRFCRDLKKKSLVLSPAALEALQAYRWPGNVRELQNCIERAVILADGDAILPRHLNLSFIEATPVEAPNPWSQVDLTGTLGDVTKRAVAEVERLKIREVLREADGNKVDHVADGAKTPQFRGSLHRENKARADRHQTHHW